MYTSFCTIKMSNKSIIFHSYLYEKFLSLGESLLGSQYAFADPGRSSPVIPPLMKPKFYVCSPAKYPSNVFIENEKVMSIDRDLSDISMNPVILDIKCDRFRRQLMCLKFKL